MCFTHIGEVTQSWPESVSGETPVPVHKHTLGSTSASSLHLQPCPLPAREDPGVPLCVHTEYPLMVPASGSCSALFSVLSDSSVTVWGTFISRVLHMTVSPHFSNMVSNTYC